MSETQKFNHNKTKIMIIVEFIIFFALYFVFLWLKPVIVGLFYFLFVISLLIWIIAIVSTLVIYNRTRQELKNEK